MNHEPFDEHLSWELRSLVEDADPRPTLRPAVAVHASRLPRPVILIGSVAAAVVALAALLLSTGSSNPNRQHVASQGKDGQSATATTEVGGVLVPVQGEQGPTATTAPAGRSNPTTAKKGGSTPTTIHDGIVAHPPPKLSVTTYDTTNFGPWSIVTGPDGNLWMSGWPNSIARITPTGAVTTFPYSPPSDPTMTGLPTGITVGPDRNLWFTERGAAKIGRITTSGVMTEFNVPFGSGGPITVGGDGALWFPTGGDAPYTAAMGRMTTSGAFTKFPVDGAIYGLASGADGNIWFGDATTGGENIARMKLDGTYTKWPVSRRVYAATPGPDGNVWFFGGASVGRVTPNGAVREYDTGISAIAQPSSIATGPDGNLWFVGYGPDGDEAGRVTLSGQVTIYPSPLPPRGGQSSNPTGITRGPDGNVWFTEAEGRVGKFPPPSS